jgi:hypothetical protein
VRRWLYPHVYGFCFPGVHDSRSNCNPYEILALFRGKMGSENRHCNTHPMTPLGLQGGPGGAYATTTLVMNPAHFPSLVLPTTNTGFSGSSPTR